MKNLGALEKLVCFTRQSSFNETIKVYNLLDNQLHNDVPICYALRKDTNLEESQIRLFYDTKNEMVILNHELSIIMWQQNVFIMKYENYIIICISSVADYIHELIKEKETHDFNSIDTQSI